MDHTPTIHYWVGGGDGVPFFEKGSMSYLAWFIATIEIPKIKSSSYTILSSSCGNHAPVDQQTYFSINVVPPTHGQ